MHQGNAQQTATNGNLITLHIRIARLHIFSNSARTLSEQPALGIVMSRIFNNFVLLYPSLQAMHKIKIKTLKLIKLYQLHRQG